MSKFKMEFYNASSGVVFMLSWNSEEDYRDGQQFLKRLTVSNMGPVAFHPDKPDFYYLENDQQRDALYAFRRELKKRRELSRR